MTRPLKFAALAALLCLSLSLAGCAVVGYLAAVVPGPPMKARYAGLAGQRVAIIAWADRATAFDYPKLVFDTASSVQNKLKAEIAANPKDEELLGTTFVDSKQVFRWQKDRPEMQSRPLNEMAASLAAQVGATRVVYIELSPFTTRDVHTEALLKGNAGVTIRVAEVAAGTVKIGFDEANVPIEFPEHAPEGVPATDQMTDLYIYTGLVDALTTEISLRFFSYTDEK